MVLFPKEKVPYSTWYFFLLVLFPSIPWCQLHSVRNMAQSLLHGIRDIQGHGVKKIVSGTWSGPWCQVHGQEHGVRYMVWYMVSGTWCQIHGVRGRRKIHKEMYFK